MQLVHTPPRAHRDHPGETHKAKPSVFLNTLLIAMCCGLFLTWTPRAVADSTSSPELLVLGDSQLSFGAGKVMLNFFKNIRSHCRDVIDPMSVLDDIEMMKTALIGVRSSSLDSWLSKSGAARAKLCRKDKKWGVNASVWGSLKTHKTSGVHYVQIGEHKPYRFCKRNTSALQALFSDGYYRPRLIVFNLLGNGVTRWANSQKLADFDVFRLSKQLPRNMPCVFMTTMPNYSKVRNRHRLKAQKKH